MRRTFAAIFTVMALAGASCQRFNPPAGPPGSPDLRMEPLPVQQVRAYPDMATGNFMSLADFEDSSAGRKASQQVEDFVIESAASVGAPALGGSIKYVTNITRTGAGAIEVVLPVGKELVFRNLGVHDLGGYTLLSLALYSQTLRDDLQVTLVSGGSTWTGHRTLVEPGWNTVQIDIARLGSVSGFNIKDVRSIRIGFANAAMDIDFNLDDIMVINNRRDIPGAPAGLRLGKSGLDYSLAPGGLGGALALSQSPDGLWRWGAAQPQVQMAAPGAGLKDAGEQLEPMGESKVGVVSLLECNSVRVRIASTWYFPSRRGEWASSAVRRIRWGHTFYGDGRCIISVEINNAGGQDIGPLRIVAPGDVAWMGDKVAKERSLGDFSQGVAVWNYLAASGADAAKAQRAYLDPGKVAASLGQVEPSLGDSDKDGFDESQGCYSLAARNGQCRFTFAPGAGGAANPVFRVKGQWQAPPSVNVEGLAVTEVATLEDGSVLFCLKGVFTRPTAVEVCGS